jgi:hypothetical protein
MGSMPLPELSVVVASHDRPLRLRWLLNALECQTLDRALWEVVVCHDSEGSETDGLLASHPLTGDGTLRSTRLPPGAAPPGTNRNAALGLASASTIVFTDDDCRPPEDWLANVRAALRTHPGAIIQGPIWGDPDEAAMRRSIYFRTHDMLQVPRPWAECCNIVYPRAIIDRAGGFPEDMYTGEDTTLRLRAAAFGTPYVGEPNMLTYHAIEESGVLGRIRGAGRWHDLPLLYKRSPELRRHLAVRIFWKRTHALLPVAIVGVGLARRSSVGWLLVLPWAIQRQVMQPGMRGRVRHVLQLPGWAAVDLAEMAVLIRGSVRHRSVLL